jgi:hypothetical protein
MDYRSRLNLSFRKGVVGGDPPHHRRDRFVPEPPAL